MLLDPSTLVDRKITENHAAIPLFTLHFHPKDLDNGNMFLYPQGCSGIRDNNGIKFLYLRQRILHASSQGLQIVCGRVNRHIGAIKTASFPKTLKKNENSRLKRDGYLLVVFIHFSIDDI
jgi:hypothetical protein